MTIKLGFDTKNGNFFIEYNDAFLLTDAGERLDLDNYLELIFDERTPFAVEVYSNEHDLVRHDYSVMIHQSLIHSGEDEPAIFSTTSRVLVEYIERNVIPGTVIPIRAKRFNNGYDLDFTTFRKGLRVYDPQSDT
jgi:hypothetical protein